MLLPLITTVSTERERRSNGKTCVCIARPNESRRRRRLHLIKDLDRGRSKLAQFKRNCKSTRHVGHTTHSCH